MFSRGSGTLDPRFFNGSKMHPEVREELLNHYYKGMEKQYANPHEWSHVWMAGSGASYQWKADRNPADLDMLVGVDYPQFRYHNPKLRGLTDKEVSWVLNQYMRKNLAQDNWHGTHEMTWYNNPESADIRKLNPYAAYSLTEDDWHVQPNVQDPMTLDFNHSGDLTKAQDILNRYNKARTALERRDLRPELRRAHAQALNNSLQQGHALFEDIHGSRKKAFLPGGLGYADPANVRWQTGKATGVVHAMRTLAEQYKKGVTEQQLAQYGMVFPDVNELVIRAMIQDDER